MRPRWYVPVATLSLAGGSMLAFAGTAAASSAAIRSDHVSVATRSGHVRVVPRSRHVRVLLGGRAHMIRPFISARRVRNTVTASNWSGYAAHNGPYKSISASWVEPRGHCSGSGHKYSSFWVGLDGFNSGSVEQTGSEVDCKNGSPKYYSWFEMFPKFPVTFHNTVRPGDHFHGSVTYNGGGRFTLKLSDTTRRLDSHRAQVAQVSPALVGRGHRRGALLQSRRRAAAGQLRHRAYQQRQGERFQDRQPPSSKIIMQAGSTRKDTVSRLANGQNFSATWRHS